MEHNDLTQRLVGAGPDSLSGRRRRRRWALLDHTFPDLSEMTVLDLGGTAASWRTAGLSPKRLVLLNLDPPGDIPGAVSIVGDACDPPAALRNERFDLVFSNSVIEHLGGHARRQAFAETATRLGDRLWIQTPYRYFPVEPHFVAPGFQFLPVGARARAVVAWPIGNYAALRSVPDAVRSVQQIELLSRSQMRAYFPGCDLLSERFAGMTKSLTAVR